MTAVGRHIKNFIHQKPEPLTLYWCIRRRDEYILNFLSFIITCPVRPNSNEYLNEIFTLVFNHYQLRADEQKAAK